MTKPTIHLNVEEQERDQKQRANKTLPVNTGVVSHEQALEDNRLQGAKQLSVCDATVTAEEAFVAWCCEDGSDCYDDVETYAKEIALTGTDMEMLLAAFLKFQNEIEEHFDKKGFPSIANPFNFIQLKAKIEAWAKVGWMD